VLRTPRNDGYPIDRASRTGHRPASTSAINRSTICRASLAASTSPRFVLGRVHVPGAKSIATITFSLYLSHKMTWHVTKTYLPGLVAGGGVQAFFVYAFSALIIGSLLYFLVERPFLLLRDRLEDRPVFLGVEPSTISAEPSR